MESINGKLIAGLIPAVLLAVAGCLTGLPEAGTADAKLYREKCTACHSWAHPGRHTPEEWNHYLKLMKKHMDKKGIPFSEQEKETIRDYLHRNARS